MTAFVGLTETRLAAESVYGGLPPEGWMLVIRKRIRKRCQEPLFELAMMS